MCDIFHRELYLKNGEKIFINKSVYLPTLEEHTHDFLEIVYICSGSGIHQVNGKEYRVIQGDVFFINFKVTHGFKPLTEDFRWINCVFLPEVFNSSLINSDNAEDLLEIMLFKPIFSGKIDSLFGVSILNRQEEFDYIFRSMLKEYETQKIGHQLILQSYLTILLSKIFRFTLEEKEENKDLLKNKIVSQVICYLKDNYSKPFTIDEIARQVFLSPTYFSSLFKSTTGSTVIEYIHRIRIEEACRLINEKNIKISEVISEVGYSDSKFFYSIFKRYVKMTPGQYKKRNE